MDKSKITPKYKFGEKYIVSYKKEDLEKLTEEDAKILIAYEPRMFYPFICVLPGYEQAFKEGKECGILAWKYAKQIPKKKCKAYKRTEIEWIGKSVILKNGEKKEIIGTGWTFDHEPCIYVGSVLHHYSLNRAAEVIKWEDGKPFGELIK